MFNKIFFKLWPKSIFLQKMDLTRVRQLNKADYQCEWNYYKNIHKKQKRWALANVLLIHEQQLIFMLVASGKTWLEYCKTAALLKKILTSFTTQDLYFLSNSYPLNKYLRIVILKRIGKSEIKNWFHIIINKDNYGMYFAIKGQTLQQDLVNNLVILYHNKARICMFHRFNTLSNLWNKMHI